VVGQWCGGPLRGEQRCSRDSTDLGLEGSLKASTKSQLGAWARQGFYSNRRHKG
jgi:hypothetical protein